MASSELKIQSNPDVRQTETVTCPNTTGSDARLLVSRSRRAVALFIIIATPHRGSRYGSSVEIFFLSLKS
jgi:hypothetical protein